MDFIIKWRMENIDITNGQNKIFVLSHIRLPLELTCQHNKYIKNTPI